MGGKNNEMDLKETGLDVIHRIYLVFGLEPTAVHCRKRC